MVRPPLWPELGRKVRLRRATWPYRLPVTIRPCFRAAICTSEATCCPSRLALTAALYISTPCCPLRPDLFCLSTKAMNPRIRLARAKASAPKNELSPQRVALIACAIKAMIDASPELVDGGLELQAASRAVTAMAMQEHRVRARLRRSLWRTCFTRGHLPGYGESDYCIQAGRRA